MRRIERFLAARRKSGRRSVFIVYNKCGDGSLLIRAAIAGRDPAIGFHFLVRAKGTPCRPTPAERTSCWRLRVRAMLQRTTA